LRTFSANASMLNGSVKEDLVRPMVLGRKRPLSA
jgi:hypothetical protein